MGNRVPFISLLIIIVSLFACGTVMAEGQTNPRRKHVEETIQWKNEKRVPGLFRENGPTLTVNCTKTPTLAEPGIFTVTVNNGGDYTDWRFEYGITDTARDPYGYVYFSEATDNSTFEDFVFYTAGEYELDVYLYKKDDLRNYAAKLTYPFTVAAMSGYPTLEEKAVEIVNQCKVDGNAWQTALNLHNWLTHHTYYDLNYQYYGADVLFRGKGVCDSYSKAFKLLCEKADISAERVTSSRQNHAWNVIKLGGTWYQVDVTWDDPSGKTVAVSGKENYVYYCLSDDTIFLDHNRYDVSYDPGCPSMEMNYYIVKNKWQMFGKYNSAGDTIIGYFLDRIGQGYASNLLFFLDDWYEYWPTNKGYWIDPVRQSIYVYGMQQKTNWTLANGGDLTVEIELNVFDGVLSLNVIQWKNVTETGTLTLPASVRTIEANALEETNATTVIIPDSCQTIGTGAFKNSAVRTVYVPATVTSVADDAFDGCERIIFILNTPDSDFADYARAKGHLVIEP